MARIDRRTFIQGLGSAISLAPGITLTNTRTARAGEANADLTKINPTFLASPQEARDWHVSKDSMGGPTLAGSPSWRHFLEATEQGLRACGVVDVVRNPWKYQRWHTTEWPDQANWSLEVDGRKTKVASYACNSGSTGAEGVSGQLVVYRPGMPPAALRGKIALVLKPTFDEELRLRHGKLAPQDRPASALSVGDYEYLADAATFPDPLRPMAELGAVSPFTQMGLGTELGALTKGGAIGALIVVGLSYDALAGTYSFPVPPLHDMPSLYIDRDTGFELLEAAGTSKSATLRLIGQTEECETWQLFGYLPGKNYATPNDEQVLLVTHTDGPSISQENGALGILGIVKYFARIPQAERPRTLMIFLDCRHYMPGAETAFAAQDYALNHPDLYKRVIAAMGVEHLGQIKVEESAEQPFHRTDLAEVSTIWISNNQRLVDIAIKAANDNRLARVQVQCPDRLGVHGQRQGRQFGLGGIARRLGIPGASTMGMMGAYWSTKARIDYLDADHFVDQVATMSQICGELMTADIEKIRSENVSPPT